MILNTCFVCGKPNGCQTVKEVKECKKIETNISIVTSYVSIPSKINELP